MSSSKRKTEKQRETFMREALALARQGLESVSPNPMVGAVIVRGGRVVARGFHRRFGGPHAEVEALRQASNPRGCDLYVSLEPCAHRGKTPPCTDAIIDAGIRRVFYAVGDPNPLTRGKGPRRLRRAGIEVHAGLLRREAARLNQPFFFWVRSGRPWILLKWGMSLDGKIATSGGESQWITGRQARACAHGLRRRVDAVLVGTRTAIADDPLLTPRPALGRRPHRVVVDRRGVLPLRLKLFEPNPGGGKSGPRVYATSRAVSPRRVRELERRGLRVLVIPEGPGGLDLEALLGELGAIGISQILVEGGGALAGSLVQQGLVDEIAAFVAPRVLGGEAAPTPVGGPGIASLAGSLDLETWGVQPVGDDLLIQGVVGKDRRASGRKNS